ncbi:MAG TPA: DUF58 domain-containing protein [Ectothiorhodospiraceae bacterium]|nr:DUF58 domain-containing protein [Ectothiorhodospiraceae bacterium]
MLSLVNPFQRWHQFIERIRERERRQPSPVRLNLRRIFILPTRSGLIFVVTLMAMLIGAINYNNSLGFILTFTLVGLGLVAILHTFRNVFRTTLQVKHASPIFAGGVAHFSLTLAGEGGYVRRALEVMTPTGVVRGIDIGGKDLTTIDLAQKCDQRGRHYLDRMTLRSIYPLGLFRAWAPVNMDAHVVVYPTPVAAGPLPERVDEGDSTAMISARGDDDFHSMRPYQQGDSLRQVHWKGVAKGQAMMSKQYGGGCTREVWLDWHRLAPMGVEERLSHLCQWVLDADKQGFAYGLSIPDRRIESGQGVSHKRACLEALALFGLGDEDEVAGG